MTPMLSGFRPEFRANRLWPLLPAALLAACQAPDQPVEEAELPVVELPAESEPDPLELAREALAAGDTSRALNRIEDALPDHDQEASIWLLYGDTLLRFTEEEIASGRADPGVIEGCFADAGNAFQRARELEPGAWTPLYGLARARRAPELEFYADACAPEGALYADGELVGYLPGIRRL